ncbi:hypothetical protein EGW08_007856, partial [Elysia chlorotica]
MARKLFSKDLYAILGVPDEASEKELIKGYRKKALKCHPDKNPDNPKAAELFHELSEALEVLTDAAARAAYDQSRKAKKAALERNKVLDSKRKKFKEDLEAREQAVNEQNQKEKDIAKRILKQGSRQLLEQEQERLREELRKQAPEVQQAQAEEGAGETPRIKLKWKAAKDDPDNGGYSSDYLNRIFSCYGHISTLLVSAKRKGSAIVEFESSGVSSDILEETGHKDNPLSLVWLSGKPINSKNSSYSSGVMNNANLFGSTATSLSSDFESLVLMKMRQAEERKKLIEQMMKEDGE